MSPNQMNHTNADQFGWVGQFLSFAPGEKSPCQYLLIGVLATETESVSEPIEYSAKIDKSLLRMMLGYLKPQDWIRVVGKAKIDARTGEWQWKAREIVKISEGQAIDYAQKRPQRTEQTTTDYKQQPAKILMCQKAGCRQRGAQSVERAIAQAINTHHCAQQIEVVATGCMKQCKTGTHMVVIPSKQQKEKAKKAMAKSTRYDQVKPQSVDHIIKQLLQQISS